MPAWIPAVIAGAGALASGAASLFGAADANRTNRKIADSTNAANAQLQKEQNAYNLEMWQRNNEYNSPEQQVLRLKQAGLNPFMSTAAIAQSQGSTSPAASAPYTPTVKPDYNSPLSALAPSISNSANDFISTYMNMRMQNAQIDKVEAEADTARADANAISGYRRDVALSEVDKNAYTAKLASAQTELTKINSSIASTFGNQQAAADLASSVQQTLESKSRVINNEKQAEQIVANTVESYAKSRNLNLSSNQIAALTSLMVSKLKLENQAQIISNDMSSTNLSILKDYGREKARLGNQALHGAARKSHNEANILRKQDQFFWWKQGLDYGSTAVKTLTDIIPTKSATKSAVKSGVGFMKNK